MLLGSIDGDMAVLKKQWDIICRIISTTLLGLIKLEIRPWDDGNIIKLCRFFLAQVVKSLDNSFAKEHMHKRMKVDSCLASKKGSSHIHH